MNQIVAKKAGRPSSADLVPRERILAAAARLFRERGYQATTVRDIAREVGILSGSLFHHFVSKEQMLVELVREAAISICVGAEAAVASVTPPAAQLRAIVRLELDGFVNSRMRDHYAAGVSEWRDVPESAQPELRMLRQRYFTLFRSVLDACAAEGRLRVAPDAAMKVLNSATTGSVTWFRQDGHYSVDVFTDILMKLVLNDARASVRRRRNGS
ncbi:MAG TPA: TetR/AcrR family transcriptional regulator [Polyangia bacterium]